MRCGCFRLDRDTLIFAILFLFNGLFILVDIIEDSHHGPPLNHLFIEGGAFATSLFGLACIGKTGLRFKRRIGELGLQLKEASLAAEKWKVQASDHLKGLNHLIDRQFKEWKLSPSEKEIVLLMLKGLSHKEIAEIRETNERTVRVQANSIYCKSGLKNRAQLSAFFLGGLMSSPQSNSPDTAE
jgi:DNA-binding CsgD family transcriptional regulator